MTKMNFIYSVGFGRWNSFKNKKVIFWIAATHCRVFQCTSAAFSYYFLNRVLLVFGLWFGNSVLCHMLVFMPNPQSVCHIKFRLECRKPRDVATTSKQSAETRKANIKSLLKWCRSFFPLRTNNHEKDKKLLSIHCSCDTRSRFYSSPAFWQRQEKSKWGSCMSVLTLRPASPK